MEVAVQHGAYAERTEDYCQWDGDAPDNANQFVKFNTHKNQAFAIITLFVQPLLLYLLKNPNDPVAV